MPQSLQAGAVLGNRYRLDDLLAETRGGRLWRAHDTALHRPVAVHVIARSDERAYALLAAAKQAGLVNDPRILRVLDADITDDACYVVGEWGFGSSLEAVLEREGALPPRRIGWLMAEVAEAITNAHAQGLAHGRLVPENVLVDSHGQVHIIGFGVDAALWGLPPGRRSADVTDLAGLVYCGLTGKWPGVSRSNLPPAPLQNGRVLRPRQVRAGIPRPLDTLCDQILNPVSTSRPHRLDQDLTTAQGVFEVLHEFVGGPTPVPNATAVAALPASPEHAPTPEILEAPEPEPVEPEPTLGQLDEPTQAAIPVFDDSADDAGHDPDWRVAREEPPQPAPPLADATPKPLFAPEPPAGQPQRRPRAGAATPVAAPADPYWPWDNSAAGPLDTDHALPEHALASESWPTDTGAWHAGAFSAVEAPPDDRVPGRSWNRLAMIIGVCALILFAAVATHQFRKSDTTEDPTPSGNGTSASTPAKTLAPFPILGAVDFDPQGSPPEENPSQIPFLSDGDPATSWQTMTYKQNFGPDGIKTGVGVILDLGATKGVREISLDIAGGVTAVAAYVTGKAPASIADLTPVGTALGSDTLSIPLEEAVSGRYVTIWLTSLPAATGGFQATISEIRVLG